MCIGKCLFVMKTISLNSGVSKHNHSLGAKFQFTYYRSDVTKGRDPQIPHTSIYHSLLQIQTGLLWILVGGDKNIDICESNHSNTYTCRGKYTWWINDAIDFTLREYILWVGSSRNLPTSDFLQQQTFYLWSLSNKSINMGTGKNLK